MLSSPEELKGAMDREPLPPRTPLDPRDVAPVALGLVAAVHVVWGAAYLLYNAVAAADSTALNWVAWALVGAGVPFALLAILGRFRPQPALLLGLLCLLVIHYGLVRAQGGLGSLFTGFIPRILAAVILLGGWLNCRGGRTRPRH